MRGSFNPIIFRFCQRNLNIKLVLLLPNPATYTVSPKTQHQTNISKLGIVDATQAPEIRFEGFSRSKGGGAVDTMGKIFVGSFQGRELGILLLPITLPVGAIIGAALAPSADTVKRAEEELAKNFQNRTIMACLHDQIIVAAKHNGVRWQPISLDIKHSEGRAIDYKFLSYEGIDTILELAITGISAKGEDLNAPLSLHMQAHARLLATENNTEIVSTDVEYSGERHTRLEWEADNSKMLLHALAEGCEVLGKHIYENVFMLYPFPDQEWHTSFPKGTLGLAPIDPPLGFFLEKVKNLHPTLRWQGFPRGSDVKEAPQDMAQVKNVRYDLFVAEPHGDGFRIIYQREGLQNPEHTIEKSLRPETEYKWSVRARFELYGSERVTEWSGLALGLSPKFDRRLVPPLGNSYIFETP
jgi:hypothetical protein